MKTKQQRGNRSPVRERHELIALLAYELYEQEGRPDGKALEHWFNAEAMVESQFGQGAKRLENLPLVT